MRELYTSKVFSKPPCLIAKIKLEKSVQLEAQKLSNMLGVKSTPSVDDDLLCLETDEKIKTRQMGKNL